MMWILKRLTSQIVMALRSIQWKVWMKGTPIVTMRNFVDSEEEDPLTVRKHKMRGYYYIITIIIIIITSIYIRLWIIYSFLCDAIAVTKMIVCVPSKIFPLIMCSVAAEESIFISMNAATDRTTHQSHIGMYDVYHYCCPYDSLPVHMLHSKVAVQMGLALCHRIPRDPAVYAALALMFCSTVLQAVCIGMRQEGEGCGTLKDSTGTVGAVPAYPMIKSSTQCSSGPDCHVVMCSSDMNIVRIECARFLEGFHNVNRCVVAAFVLSICAIVFCLLFSMALHDPKKSVTHRHALAVCWPVGFLCAALATFFESVVPAAKSLLSVDLHGDESKIHFHMGTNTNLYIAATAIGCMALLILLINWGYWLFSTVSKGPRGRLKLADDDWERQREVLTNHARAVSAEIQFKAEVDPTFTVPTPVDPWGRQVKLSRRCAAALVRRGSNHFFLTRCTAEKVSNAAITVSVAISHLDPPLWSSTGVFRPQRNHTHRRNPRLVVRCTDVQQKNENAAGVNSPAKAIARKLVMNTQTRNNIKDFNWFLTSSKVEILMKILLLLRFTFSLPSFMSSTGD
eukprot:gene5081-3667_t